MTCEELSQEYGTYALGIAEDPERREIAEHLARQCPICKAGVKDALEIVFAMGAAVKTAEPPSRLRRRIVSMVTPEKGGGWAVFLPWAVAGVLAIALASITVPARLRPPVPEARLDQMLSILNDPVTKDVTFGVPTARGRVFVSPGKGVVLIAAHLPAIDASKAFELWVIPAQGKPIPAGTFRSAEDSTAIYVHSGPIDNAAAVAVTVEPRGGSAQPTTTPFIVTKL